MEFVEWAAPIVPVIKSDSSVHVCGDYKVTVNRVAKVDSYPLPRIDDLFASLAGGKLFFKLDLANAYQQIPLADILMTGATDREHLQNLQEGPICLVKVGIRLKKDKCAFMLAAMEYLGHEIT